MKITKWKEGEWFCVGISREYPNFDYIGTIDQKAIPCIEKFLCDIYEV